MQEAVIGRFAPSPTGPLHRGSLVAALGSYLSTKSQGGRWLVRIEDIDAQRSLPGVDAAILSTLEAYGFEWDGEVLYQSRRLAFYEAAIDALTRNGLLYACACSRREVAENARLPGIYPGTCRQKPPKKAKQYALRIKTDNEPIGFEDGVYGAFTQRIEQEVGDFVLLRADGEFAYQLAVVVDDALSGVTEVVRGYDLLDSTPRQIYLQRRLGYKTPRYAHLPLVMGADGQKLSKQNLAEPIEAKNASAELVSALSFLGQKPPPELCAEHPATLLEWATANWRLADITP